MKKFVTLLAVAAIVLSCALCSAAERTGILIIAPVEFKSQDFIQIATETFGKNYDISKGTQDDWATYCWDKGLTDTDALPTKETLADFAATTNYDKIIFIIFKDANKTEEDLGYSRGPFWSISHDVRYRTAVGARVVIMTHEGQTLKVFDETHTDDSKSSDLRASRGAFKGLCKQISDRLGGKKK